MMKWGCSLVCCSAPTAAMCCISSGIRTRTASRTVISAAATRSVPVTVRHTLSAPTFLTAGVLSNLRQVTEYAARHESRFVKLLIQQNEIGGKRKTAAATKQLEQAQTRIAEVNRIIKRLYEDNNVSGKISDERFMELSADYEQEQRELKDRAAALQEELSKSQAATVNAEKFMGIVRKHLAFEELTPTLLREMIEKIVVHECSYDENGTRRQDIEIYYSFVGKIDLPEA